MNDTCYLLYWFYTATNFEQFTQYYPNSYELFKRIGVDNFKFLDAVELSMTRYKSLKKALKIFSRDKLRDNFFKKFNARGVKLNFIKNFIENTYIITYAPLLKTDKRPRSTYIEGYSILTQKEFWSLYPNDDQQSLSIEEFVIKNTNTDWLTLSSTNTLAELMSSLLAFEKYVQRNGAKEYKTQQKRETISEKRERAKLIMINHQKTKQPNDKPYTQEKIASMVEAKRTSLFNPQNEEGKRFIQFYNIYKNADVSFDKDKFLTKENSDYQEDEG